MQLGLVASPSSPLRCHLAKLVTCAVLQMGILGALEGGRLGTKAPFFVWAPWGVCVKQQREREMDRLGKRIKEG